MKRNPDLQPSLCLKDQRIFCPYKITCIKDRYGEIQEIEFFVHIVRRRNDNEIESLTNLHRLLPDVLRMFAGRPYDGNIRIVYSTIAPFASNFSINE